LTLDLSKGTPMAIPSKVVIRKRFKLSELFKNVTPEAIQQLNTETEWAREGSSVGRELIYANCNKQRI